MGILSHLHLPGGHPIDGLGHKPPKTYGIHPHPDTKRKLDFYIKTNHITNSYLFNNRQFFNHVPHSLICAYFLGATPKQIEDLYEAEYPVLTSWRAEKSFKELTDDNWKQGLGQKEYVKSFYDYFSGKIKHTDFRHDWKEVAGEFYSPENNFSIGLFGGLTHPLIHLGYAVEDGSPLLAIEALSMTGTEYFDFDKVLNSDTSDGAGSASASYALTTDPLEILSDIRNDEAFDNKLKGPNMFEKIAFLFTEFPAKLRYYTYRLDTSDVKETVKRLLHTGVLLSTATHKDNEPAFDFYLLHTLTATIELAEIIFSSPGLHIFPPERQPALIHQLWTTIIALYIASFRPSIDPARIPTTDKPIDELWKDTIHKTLSGPKRFDEHLPKATRAFLITELFLQDHTGLYARAASHFVNARPHNNEYHISRIHEEYAGLEETTTVLDIRP